MILDLLSFRSEFCSRVKFVVNSHDNIEQHILRCFCLCSFRTRLETRVPLIPNYMICDLLSVTKKEISYQNGSFIWNENRNELIPGWLVREWNVISVSCKQIRTKKHGDGTNSFQNESHSGFLWAAPKPLTFCCTILIVSHYFYRYMHFNLWWSHITCQECVLDWYWQVLNSNWIHVKGDVGNVFAIPATKRVLL